MRIIFIIFLLTSSVFAQNWDIGNTLNFKEFPDTFEPAQIVDPSQIISGSVTKNVNMSLDNCIRIALGNNPEINSAFQDILVSDSKIKQIWSNFFPQFSWETSYNHIKQLQLSDALSRNLEYEYYLLGEISLQAMLYDFGVTQNQATIQRLAYNSDKQTFASVVNDVIYRTKAAYYKAQYAYEAAEVAQRTVDNYQKFYDQAKAFYKIGLNPKVDVTIAQVNLSNSKIQLIQAQNAVNVALAQLNNIMGVPYIQKYSINEKLDFNPMEITFDDAVCIARKARPELKQAEILVEKARQNVKLAKKAYFPMIDTNGQYMVGGKHWTSNDGWNISLALDFPMINGLLIRNQIKEANYLYDKQLANARRVQNNIYLEIQTAYLNLNERRNQLPVAELQVKQAKENYDLSFGRYKVGEASPIELREAENTLRNSQLTYYNSLYEYNTARAQLEKSIGQNISNTKDTVKLKKDRLKN